MTPEQRVQTFVDYARTLKGDEKGEAQVFVDRLFQAFGHGADRAVELAAESHPGGGRGGGRLRETTPRPR